MPSPTPLRIALLGQMMSGKTTLLETLLSIRLPNRHFPTSGIPLRICHAAQNSAELQFYSTTEWRELSRLSPDNPLREASTTAQHAQWESMVNELHRCHIDPSQHLDRTLRIDSKEGPQALLDRLADRLGELNQQALLVRSITLHLDLPSVQGLEIIEAPSDTDMLPARQRETQAWLANSDLLLMLSSLGQFLTSSDLAMLREAVPADSARMPAVQVVGTQRDLALRHNHYLASVADKVVERFPEAQRPLARVCAMQQLLDRQVGEFYQHTLETQLAQPDLDAHSRTLLDSLSRQKPLLVSAWAGKVADDFATLAEDDQYHLQQLNTATGYSFTPDSLRQLANLDALREVIDAQRHAPAQAAEQIPA